MKGMLLGFRLYYLIWGLLLTTGSGSGVRASTTTTPYADEEAHQDYLEKCLALLYDLEDDEPTTTTTYTPGPPLNYTSCDHLVLLYGLDENEDTTDADPRSTTTRHSTTARLTPAEVTNTTTTRPLPSTTTTTVAAVGGAETTPTTTTTTAQSKPLPASSSVSSTSSAPSTATSTTTSTTTSATRTTNGTAATQKGEPQTTTTTGSSSSTTATTTTTVTPTLPDRPSTTLLSTVTPLIPSTRPDADPTMTVGRSSSLAPSTTTSTTSSKKSSTASTASDRTTKTPTTTTTTAKPTTKNATGTPSTASTKTAASNTTAKPVAATTTTVKWDTTTAVSHMPVSWHLSTTDYASKDTKPASTTSKPTTTSGQRKTNPPTTTSSYCEQTCPDEYFEGANGCLMLMNDNGTYTEAVGRCQALDKGDLIGPTDIQPEFAAISQLMKAYGMPTYKFFVNMYQSDLVRKEKQAQVVYISSSSVALTANASIVPRSEQQNDVGSICKIPKNCLQWTCPTSYALQDAPNMEFDDPQPLPVLNYEEKLKYRCKNQSINNDRWGAYCTDRGSIGPSAAIYDHSCKVDENAPPVRPPIDIVDEPIPNLTCAMCVDMGTDHCERGKNGEPDKCICNEGWRGINCWRFPKFCPNMTCPEESDCEERVDHAVCVCQTEMCVVMARRANRTAEMKFLDSAVMFAGPTFEFFMRMVMQVLFPERGETIQDSLQYMRATFVSCAGVIYVFGGDPSTLKIEIAERRIMSIFFHFPQILVHLMFALECYHIDCVMRGTSDNKWQTCSKERKKRWDYGWTYAPTITLAFFFSIAIWYLNWDSHQRAFTSVGVMDSNFGMLGWASIAYGMCATYSFFHSLDMLLDRDRKYYEVVRRDNFYETSSDPSKQEEEDMCWRNLVTVMLGAPVQAAYSISMIANLAWDAKEIKYINLGLLLLNTIMGAIQTIMCDRKFLGWIESWQMMHKPLEENYNQYNYLTTSEVFAKKGRPAYEEMLRKRAEAEEERKAKIAEKIAGYKAKFEAEGIPMFFLPHAPLEGPEPCKKWNYDPCHRTYLCAREREWKFIQWTDIYLGARVKVGINVVDACEHVRDRLLDTGFLIGDECSSNQAWVMYREWVDMMLMQDRMDQAKPRHGEKQFHKRLGRDFMADLAGLSIANKLRESPICPKKRRLLAPVCDMFAYSCPDAEEKGPGLWKDQFGMMWEADIVKDLPVITRAQEAARWQDYVDDEKAAHARYDQIYTDDHRYNLVPGAPWEAALRETHHITNAFPEGRNVRSLNPRKGPIDYTYMEQTRPDFIGPKEPEYQIPCGPLLRRHWLEKTYAQTRERMFNMIVEQAGQRRNNFVIRNYIKDNKK